MKSARISACKEREDNTMTETIYTVFSPEGDMTFIMRDTFEGEDLKATEVVGWYFGGPTESATEQFIGKLKAEF
jgi:hypothetical protein